MVHKNTHEQTEEVRKQHRTSEFRELTLEKKFVGGILQNPTLFRKNILQFDPHALSSNVIKWIYERAVEMYHEEGIIMDTGAFELTLNMKLSLRKRYKTMWSSLMKLGKKVTENEVPMLRKKLLRLYQARCLEVGMQQSLRSLMKAKSGDDKYIDEAVESFTVASDQLKVKDTPVIITDPVSKVEDFEKTHKRIQKNPNEFLGVPTGIKQLDQAMKGLRRSELGLVTGGTGVGKSVALLDMASYAYENIGDVIYVTIEMPENQVRERFYCRMTGIDYNYFRNYELTEEHFHRINQTIKQYKDSGRKFHIVDIPESATVDVIKAQVEGILNKHNVCACYVDYLNIIRASGGNISLDWTSQIEIAINMKQKLARYFQLPFWTANQLAGAEHDKEDLKISDMGFAKNLVDNFDVGVFISVSEDYDETNFLKIGYTKTRDFCGKPFYVKDNRAKMRFSDPEDTARDIEGAIKGETIKVNKNSSGTKKKLTRKKHKVIVKRD